jgi:glycosyltransferase involved in cell wall biosynthesis
MTSPISSVIVPSFRGAHRLPTLLAQLAAQDFAGPWEIIVVVDGSVDETPTLLAAWTDRLPLRVLVNSTSQGVAAALTRGFDSAEGTYLIRCDDDLDVPPGFVAQHVAAHAGRHDLVVLSPTRDVLPNTPYARAYGRSANERALRDCYAQPPEHRWLHVAASFSLHRNLWGLSGGFDPRFAYGEDSEFGYRLWRSGAEILIQPDFEIEHRGPTTSAETRVPRAFVSGASRRLFADVHPEATRPVSRPSCPRALVWQCLVNAVATTARTHHAYGRLGRMADRVLPRLGVALGGRLVALLVEAAGRSGQL